MGADRYPRTKADTIRIEQLYKSMYVPNKENKNNEYDNYDNNKANTNWQQPPASDDHQQKTGVMFVQQGDNQNLF